MRNDKDFQRLLKDLLVVRNIHEYRYKAIEKAPLATAFDKLPATGEGTPTSISLTPASRLIPAIHPNFNG